MKPGELRLNQRQGNDEPKTAPQTQQPKEEVTSDEKSLEAERMPRRGGAATESGSACSNFITLTFGALGRDHILRQHLLRPSRWLALIEKSDSPCPLQF